MNKKINILQVYYEPTFSGITRHVGHIVENLKYDEDYSFHVLCSTADLAIPKYYKSIGIPVETVPGAKYFSIRGMFKVVRLVKKLKIDMVHIHNLQSIFWANLPKIFLPKTRFIFTPQVVNFDNVFVDRSFYLVWRHFSILIDTIVVLTEIQKSQIVKERINKVRRIDIIPNSVCADDGKNETSGGGILSPKPSKPNILVVARLERQKNLNQIVDIAEKISPLFPELNIYIAGEGSLHSNIRAYIREKGLENRVILLGFRKDAFQLIKESDIILSTSLWEGLPYGILEAMYLSKPIIVSDIEGHRPLLHDGETGFLATTTDEFSEKLSTLLRDEELRKKMGENGRKFFDEKYSFEMFIKKIKDLYRTA